MRQRGISRCGVVEGAQQLPPLAGGAAQHGVDQARRRLPPPTGVPLGELDRLVDGGVIRDRVGEQQLEEAEPQGGEGRGVELGDGPVGESLDQVVAGAASLNGAVGEALSLSPLASLKAVALGGGS